MLKPEVMELYKAVMQAVGLGGLEKVMKLTVEFSPHTAKVIVDLAPECDSQPLEREFMLVAKEEVSPSMPSMSEVAEDARRWHASQRSDIPTLSPMAQKMGG